MSTPSLRSCRKELARSPVSHPFRTESDEAQHAMGVVRPASASAEVFWLLEWDTAGGNSACDAPLLPTCPPHPKIALCYLGSTLVQARFASTSEICGLLAFCFARQSFSCALLSALSFE